MKTYSIAHNFIQLQLLQTNIHLDILDGKGKKNINYCFGQSLHTIYVFISESHLRGQFLFKNVTVTMIYLIYMIV
jgi:hypothetical protein